MYVNRFPAPGVVADFRSLVFAATLCSCVSARKPFCQRRWLTAHKSLAALAVARPWRLEQRFQCQWIKWKNCSMSKWNVKFYILYIGSVSESVREKTQMISNNNSNCFSFGCSSLGGSVSRWRLTYDISLITAGVHYLPSQRIQIENTIAFF